MNYNRVSPIPCQQPVTTSALLEALVKETLVVALVSYKMIIVSLIARRKK